MSMQVNGSTATPINWETLLSPLGDVKKADSVDGKTSFTITTKVGDETKTTTISIPDDLDLPETVNQGTLNGLVDKLAATGLGFTDKQRETMKDSTYNTIYKLQGKYPTKKEHKQWVEYYLKLVKNKIDALNNEGQKDMTRLQSLVDRRDEAFSTASTLMSSVSDTRGNLIRNL